MPPDEFVTEAGINASDEARITLIEKAAGISLDSVREALNGGDRPYGLEQYLYTVFGSRASICSYLGKEDIVIVFDPEMCRDKLIKRMEHAEICWERQKNEDPDLPPVKSFYMSVDEILTAIERMQVIRNWYFKPLSDEMPVDFGIIPSRQYQGNLDELRKDIRRFYGDMKTCYVFCDNTGQAERLKELLYDIEDLYLSGIARLSGGFVDSETGVAIFTDHEIFGRYRRRVRYRRFKDGLPIPDYRALNYGDFVVHVDYGIGRYMGLERIKAGGAETDCLLIVYRDEDKLHVPVDQLKRLKKYTAEEGVVPVVSKLGGSGWERLKAKTKKSIQRMAQDLLRLYAERKAFPGHAFCPDEHLVKSFEESFVYEETPDQIKAWQDVINDMENNSPMERLICGDVGFGKTEIAMRAAFFSAVDGRQVAILVPTTILAEQHEETFRDRFADFPVKIESISRFKSSKEQKEILNRLAAGQVDIIIGTHRLLSGDVLFKNLGLLIVDEEQRFGVRHKEKIKNIRKNIDVLSMSATPIPRTLNMSMFGARDISFINTPPADRYSVHTEVVPFDEKFLIEAVMREIDRDGQVFFVHNRVKSIDSMANYLRNIMPSVSFCVVHGQLSETELEKRMYEFYHGKHQVLVTTMIIENGLDIPKANTIIINRADTFGLSQLYQLRGRVGRTNLRAFAYLLIPPKVTLTSLARQRLKTIEEFAALGNGFNIAMRDLEYRGAGNILGTEQSGFISEVGFDLYFDLLHETIAEIKGLKLEKPPEVEIKSREDAFLPEKYIPDANERVLFYRRISETVNSDEVREIMEELTDRYGKPAKPVRNLIDNAYIKHFAASAGASEISFSENEVTVSFPESLEINRQKVEDFVKKSPVKIQFAFNKGMEIKFSVGVEEDSALAGAKKVLQAIVT